MSLLKLFGILCITIVLAEFQQNCFHADSRYDHVLPDDGLLSKVFVDSLPQCAQECFYLSGCFSVFFMDNRKCFTYSTRMDDFTPTIERKNTKYYELKGKYGNVAAGKTAVQSSTFPPFSGIYGVFKAVDDSRYPVAVQPGDSCACTGSASGEFWRVDLSDTYLIRDVAVLQRHDDTAGTSLTDVSISVGSLPNGPFTDCYNTGAAISTTRFETFTCQQPIYGRYVKIAKLVKVNFCMCEVEVYVLS